MISNLATSLSWKTMNKLLTFLTLLSIVSCASYTAQNNESGGIQEARTFR